MKYYMTFQSVGANMAVEKHLSDFIRNNYRGALVDEARIPDVLKAIEQEQERFLDLHRAAKAVRIFSDMDHIGGISFIHVGSLTIVLHHVKVELL